MADIAWQEVDIKDTEEIFPLPADENEAKLVRVALKVLRQPPKAGPNSPVSKGEFPVSVLSYGRYNLNAMLGPPPVGGGKKWKVYYFSDYEAAARMVVGLNSNLGWSLFRCLTNGLDFNKRLISIIGCLPNGIGKSASCIAVVEKFSEQMRRSYKDDGEYQLAGRAPEFKELNKKASSAFRLKSLGISVEQSSDVERTRVLNVPSHPPDGTLEPEILT